MIWLDWGLWAASACLGLALGGIVTVHLEEQVGWRERWRRTTLRRANLPMAGPPILLLGALGMVAGAHSGWALAVIALGAGATLAPLIVSNPLPPLCPVALTRPTYAPMPSGTMADPVEISRDVMALCALEEGHEGHHNSAADGSGVVWVRS